jgi:hypothetical protein
LVCSLQGASTILKSQSDLFSYFKSLKAECAPPQPGFASKFLAGFECGFLGWNSHDLLVTTRHLPDDRMGAHYTAVQEIGLLTARDGLPWRHDAKARIQAAWKAGMEVIWDLNHYDPPPEAAQHARNCALAADPVRPFWICPVNEPMIYPVLAGMSWEHATDLALLMARVAKDHHPDVRVLTTDPLTGIGERQFAATDRMVEANVVDVVGVNYYPHTARTSLLKVLLKTWRRYGKPILISETSWHDGHPTHHQRHPGFDKGAWLSHVRQQVADAEACGVEISGICWYPIVDCPPWQRPRSQNRWSHGLIRKDGTLDPCLAQEIAKAQWGGR